MPPVLPLTDDSANPLPWSSSTKSSKTKHNRKLLSACLMATLPHKAKKTMGPDPCKLFVSVSVRAALKFTDVAENSLLYVVFSGLSIVSRVSVSRRSQATLCTFGHGIQALARNTMVVCTHETLYHEQHLVSTTGGGH